MKQFIITILILGMTASTALAHGENSLGPNQGYIRMPGAYHTEVVPLPDNSIRVYLLDINWKNPTVANSSVRAKLIGKKKQLDTDCKKQNSFFLCKFDGKPELNEGKLVLESTRESQEGSKATYSLPLKLDNNAHSNH